MKVSFRVARQKYKNIYIVCVLTWSLSGVKKKTSRSVSFRGLTQNFRLASPPLSYAEYPPPRESDLTIYLPSGITEIFCQMVSTPDVPLLPEIFRWNDPKSRDTAFTFQSHFSEHFGKWYINNHLINLRHAGAYQISTMVNLGTG